jgi:hypothetical protein
MTKADVRSLSKLVCCVEHLEPQKHGTNTSPLTQQCIWSAGIKCVAGCSSYSNTCHLSRVI